MMESGREVYWNVPRETAQLLYFMVRAMRAKRVLEIGTSNGYSGVWLGQALKDVGGEVPGRLWTIESHQERYDMAGETFKKFGLQETINQVKGHAPEVFQTMGLDSIGAFDLMFFDATKKQHGDFARAALPWLRSGGVLVVDNVISHRESMGDFLDYVKTEAVLKGDTVVIGDGVFIGVKA